MARNVRAMQSNRQHSALGLALTLIVGLFLLAGPGAAPAAAQRTVSIQPPSTTAYVGDAFTLTVNVDDATGVAGFQFDLSYDGAIMAFASPPRPGSLLNGLGWVVLANQINPNLLRVLGYSPSATPLAGGSGPLVALDFNAAALGTTPVILLSVLLGDTVGNPIAAVGVEGTVTVTCPAPEAAFSGDPTSGCAPLEVCFADASTGTPTSWSWDFGDGGTSAEQNPCHTYTAPGSYTVSLTAANACSSDVETKSGYVQAGGLPTAAFSASLTSGCLPLEVCFTDQSSGYPTSWSWDFGDGATSTQQNPCHTYAAPGSYTVSLTVSNGCGEDTQVNPDYIQVGGSPTAAFSGTPTSGLAPLEVCFTNASTGSPTSWSWDFGDGESSTEPDPCHTYYSPGRYTVSLTVGNTCGSDVETKAQYLTVPFTDVPTDHWAYDYIMACLGAGIVGGYWDASYRPDDPVNRAQMAVYIARGIADPAERPGLPSYIPPATPTFPDVLSDHWAFKYIEYCYANGVVTGYWDGYHPDEVVNRAQMAVYVARAMTGGDGNVPDDPDGTPFFPDVPSTHWAYKYIEYCHDYGVVGGYWDGTYRPGDVVNRGAMAVFVQRAFELPM